MEDSYSSKTLDHLGLVAGMFDELGLGEMIDSACPSDSPERSVSTGQAIKAMIINGLGFVNKRLYLVSNFFADKPIERLLGPDIDAAQLNDDRLGRALDEVYQAGLTPLFSRIAAQALSALDLAPRTGHMDSSTVSVHGKYNSEQDAPAAELHITRGHSKDHRPDLAQATIQLICDHLHGIPLHFEVLAGNSSDSTAFRRTIKNFGEQLTFDTGLDTVVADSKLYSAETLQVLADAQFNWITRVPATLEAVRELQAAARPEDFHDLPDQAGYQARRYTCEYGDIEQDWIVYRSEQAAERSVKSLRRKVDKQAVEAAKKLRKLGGQHFHCEADARQAAEESMRAYPWMELGAITVHEVRKYSRPGRPAPDAEAEIVYRIEAETRIKEEAFDRAVFEDSLFVLATNQLTETAEAEAELLRCYKQQNTVERGFRFLKDPRVVADSLYVQKPSRVAALLFVMVCCLLVYSALEYRIRTGLKQNDQTVPDQKNKPTQKPTARWIFEVFIGIHVLTLPDRTEMVLNLKPPQRTVIQLLGYDHFYS